MKLKEYVLRIILDTDTDTIEHLSESYSDSDTLSLEINGERLEVPKDMQKVLMDIDTDILGMA